MTCTRCGHLYCVCDDGPTGRQLTRTEQLILDMWRVWLDGRKREDVEDEYEVIEPDRGPRIILDWLKHTVDPRRNHGLSITLLGAMMAIALEYGYEMDGV